METMRRFLGLTPVVFGVNAVLLVVYMAIVGGGFTVLETGIALLVALVATVAVLGVVLVAVGLLRLFRVRNAWAAVGLAFGLAAVVLGISYAGIAASMPPGDEGWNLLFVMVAAAGSVPSWLTYAIGLLVGDRRNRAAPDRAVSPTP
jgi:hypothetical protein